MFSICIVRRGRSGLNRVLILSVFSVSLLCFIKAKLYVGMVVFISLLH